MLKYIIILPLFFTACASAPVLQAGSKTAVPVPRIKPDRGLQNAAFARWKQDFIARARAKGYDEALLKSTIGRAKINPKAIHKDRNQPEFARPVWSYIDSAARPERVNTGKAKLSAHASLLDAIEARYGVDRNIIVAIWGLESSYGKIQGHDDMIDSLATLAFDGRRRSFAEAQLFAILDMLARGDVRRNQLKGSWAGAMGQTQFIPTTFLAYAVDYDGDGNKDLWQSTGDALGSTANYLARHGWKKNEPVIKEVILPKSGQAISAAFFDGQPRSIANWSALGIRPVSGQNWPENISDNIKGLKAKLIAPAGASGPVFLSFGNFDVIKKYNNSTSYALGVHVLAKSYQGQIPIVNDWPRADKALTLNQRKALQLALNRQGYNVGVVDGIIGKNTRRAIRNWQKTNGLIPDGYVNLAMLKKIIAATN